MPQVIFRRASYDYETLKPLIFGIMDEMGGQEIWKAASVIIKPNLLSPASPSKAITTHPLVVRGVAEYVISRGAHPCISDSPAMGSFEKVIRTCGLKEGLGDLPVLWKEFTKSRVVETGEPFRSIEIAEDVLEADFVINLPKLKTHTQMLMTLGVKNMYGCVVGMRKPEWHLRAGIDRDRFAQLLVRICLSAKPAMTLMDGILAMEGQGPGRSGSPREIGMLIGSRDPFALDIAVCRMVGLDPASLPTNRAAIEMGLASKEVETDGEVPEIKAFRMPEITPLIFGPDRFHGFMRKHLVQRPEVDDSLCRQCGECWRYCPADAITASGRSVAFDYEICIRCYCCIEVCPHAALKAHEPLLGKAMRKVVKR